MLKLSVITICYNNPNLEKTCESIVNQTWQDFEWIVVDGGSNDTIQQVWEKYKYRIDKFVSEPDNGIYDAMNKGIRLSKGDYLIFINAGDAFADNSVLENIFKDKEYQSGVLYGHQYCINWENNEKYIDTMPDTIDENFLILATIRHQASFIRRDLFQKYGLYEQKYKIVSDWEKWIVFLINGVEFKYLPQIIALFETCGTSGTEKDKHDQERTEVLHKYFSEDQIKNAKIKVIKEKYSVIENIFSIKNDKIGLHKIITILGLHIKIRRKNL